MFFPVELFAGKEVACDLDAHSLLPMKCRFVATGLVRHLYGNIQLWGLCSGCNQGFESFHFSSYSQEAYTRSQTLVSNSRLHLEKGHGKNKTPACASQ